MKPRTYKSWFSGIIVGSSLMNGLLQVNYRNSTSLITNQKPLTMNVTSSPDAQHVITYPTCADWIPTQSRKVLFVELHRWKEYYGPSKYKTGEYYTSATWDYALRRLGFKVERVSSNHYYQRMSAREITDYHRIFVRDPKQHHHYNVSSIMCKVRPMYFFGDWMYKKNDINYRFQVHFAEKQILSANPDDHNSFLGYFPHNLLSERHVPAYERGKVGLLYGKKPEYFDDYSDVIMALLANGFELHSTCKDSANNKCNLPVEVIRHENLNPTEFAELLKKFSFMLGFKSPVGSPSPLVGLSYGVAFLNPLRKTGGGDTQHKALSRLGFPYTYIVDLSNHTQVVQSAEWASKYRFNSYVPPQYRIESLIDRMCGILEDDSFCLDKTFDEQLID